MTDRYLTILDNSSFPDSDAQESAVHTSMDAFLASVEKRAYVIAVSACRNQDTAMDIVQDAMFSMVKSYSKKPAEQWPALFFKIVSNRVTDHHRKRGLGRLKQWFGDSNDESHSATDAVDQLTSEETGPAAMANSLELTDAMESALQNLTLKQQQALLLRLWQGLSVKETAVAMGVSEGSVKTHLSRAVHEMREHLQEYAPL